MGSNRKHSAVPRVRESYANRAAILAIILIVCVLFVALLVKGMRLRTRILENDEMRLELTEQIAAEEERTQSILELKDYYESEEFIRQAAKERLGLIEDGEIIFRPKQGE